jgi:hypothetical protein
MTSLLGDQLSYTHTCLELLYSQVSYEQHKFVMYFHILLMQWIFFWGKFSPFEKNIFWNNIPAEIPCSLIFKTFSNFWIKKMVKICHNHLQCERVSMLFYFEYCQFWLNILLDDHHLSDVTKLKKSKLKLYSWCFKNSNKYCQSSFHWNFKVGR